MRIFFSVGEPSGDLHGANLIRCLTTRDPKIECVGYGGPKMADAGCLILFDLTEMAVMFVSKVLVHLRTFLRLVGEADHYFRDREIDAVVLIDYPGFNWWIARKAKKHGIPVFYYGVPQVWAWAPWRVRKIRRLVDHVLCKLPFEVDWFSKRKCHATYVGHPFFDQLCNQTYDQAFMDRLHGSTQQLLTLLPGSRDQEVEFNLPILLDAAEQVLKSVENLKVVVACYNQRQQKMAEDMLRGRSDQINLHVGRTPELIKMATVCLACSGSVSLELLFHRKPTVIVYHLKRSVMMAQAVILRIKFITLVNLIAADDINKKTFRPYDPDAADAEPTIMPEYMTTGNPAAKIASHATQWLTDATLRQRKVEEMDVLAKRYAKPGATQRAANYLLVQLMEYQGNPAGKQNPLLSCDEVETEKAA